MEPVRGTGGIRGGEEQLPLETTPKMEALVEGFHVRFLTGDALEIWRKGRGDLLNKIQDCRRKIEDYNKELAKLKENLKQRGLTPTQKEILKARRKTIKRSIKELKLAKHEHKEIVRKSQDIFKRQEKYFEKLALPKGKLAKVEKKLGERELKQKVFKIFKDKKLKIKKQTIELKIIDIGEIVLKEELSIRTATGKLAEVITDTTGKLEEDQRVLDEAFGFAGEVSTEIRDLKKQIEGLKKGKKPGLSSVIKGLKEERTALKNIERGLREMAENATKGKGKISSEYLSSKKEAFSDIKKREGDLLNVGETLRQGVEGKFRTLKENEKAFVATFLAEILTGSKKTGFKKKLAPMLFDILKNLSMEPDYAIPRKIVIECLEEAGKKVVEEHEARFKIEKLISDIAFREAKEEIEKIISENFINLPAEEKPSVFEKLVDLWASLEKSEGPENDACKALRNVLTGSQYGDVSVFFRQAHKLRINFAQLENALARGDGARPSQMIVNLRRFLEQNIRLGSDEEKRNVDIALKLDSLLKKYPGSQDLKSFFEDVLEFVKSSQRFSPESKLEDIRTFLEKEGIVDKAKKGKKADQEKLLELLRTLSGDSKELERFLLGRTVLEFKGCFSHLDQQQRVQALEAIEMFPESIEVSLDTEMVDLSNELKIKILRDVDEVVDKAKEGKKADQEKLLKFLETLSQDPVKINRFLSVRMRLNLQGCFSKLDGKQKMRAAQALLVFAKTTEHLKFDDEMAKLYELEKVAVSVKEAKGKDIGPKLNELTSEVRTLMKREELSGETKKLIQRELLDVLKVLSQDPEKAQEVTDLNLRDCSTFLSEQEMKEAWEAIGKFTKGGSRIFDAEMMRIGKEISDLRRLDTSL